MKMRSAVNTSAAAFEKREFRDVNGHMLPYRLLVPRSYDPAERYPMVLFLHGAGEKGSDNVRQVTNGVEHFADRRNRERYSCFVVVPQCPENEWWSGRNGELSKPLRLAFGILSSLQEEFSVDAHRRYITGISMGGFGTWDAIAHRPGFFAAAVPVCGGGDADTANRMVHIPLWVFHGARDPIVPVQYSRTMVAALRAAGGTPRYTEYPGVGHASWNLVYTDPEMYAWLFAQRKEQVEEH